MYPGESVDAKKRSKKSASWPAAEPTMIGPSSIQIFFKPGWCRSMMKRYFLMERNDGSWTSNCADSPSAVPITKA